MRPRTIEICNQVSRLTDRHPLELIVDGGVTDTNAADLPANYLVTASTLLSSSSAKQTYGILKQARAIGHFA
jgi:pentose-5-phosphate-3-epimerase